MIKNGLLQCSPFSKTNLLESKYPPDVPKAIPLLMMALPMVRLLAGIASVDSAYCGP